MRYDYITPHKFQGLKSFYDTLLVFSESPVSLDIAIPHAAHRWIGQSLLEQVTKRFSGRATTMHIDGLNIGLPMEQETLNQLSSLAAHDVKFAVLLTERVLLDDMRHLQTACSSWLLFDWWQWLRKRVPDNRLADAWMYLCYACPTYLQSPERQTSGITEATALCMAEEGARLQKRLVDAICSEIQLMWADGNPIQLASEPTV